MNPLQGASKAATPAKQCGLVGMYDMLTLMRKNHFAPIVYADLYCGSGTNHIGGEVEISGSPISMLEGIRLATSRMSAPPKRPRLILFNDIMAERSQRQLPAHVEAWQRRNGLPVDPHELQIPIKNGRMFMAPISYEAMPADSAVDMLGHAINSGYHVIAAVDPNGPKDAPWQKLRSLFDRRSSRMELIIHISATTLKRVAKARANVAFDFAPMPDHIADLLEKFRGAGGWIREQVGKDQWTMLLLSKYPPRNGWNTKTGPKFFLMHSGEGKGLIHYLSTTAKEREALGL